MMSDDDFTMQTTALTPTLFRLSMSILRQEADCRDAVQQALLKAWMAKSRIDPLRFKAYLTRIVINECRNIQRLRMRTVPVAELPEPGDWPQHEQMELREAIDQLPESLRTPLLLRYMENFSDKETARALGITVAAVKNRLSRARKQLKATLIDWEVAL